MKEKLILFFGNRLVPKLESIKKFFFPTEYDREQRRIKSEQKIFYSGFIKKGSLCFDIGANIGLKSEIFSELGARVIIVEPQSECIRMLKRKFTKNEVILQKGVGAENGKRELFISRNHQLSSFLPDWAEQTGFDNPNLVQMEKIDMLTIDSLIEAYGCPDFIKIDVEGYELEALSGLSKNFKTLSFEYLITDNGKEILKCLQLLSNRYMNLRCNYASGNHYKNFSMTNWVDIKHMMEIVEMQKFKRSHSGDIYVSTSLLE